MKITSQKSHRAGFTLVELLVVMFIIAILGTIAAVGFSQVQQRVKNQQAQTFQSLLEGSIDDYFIDNAVYPAAPNVAGAGVNYAVGNTQNLFVLLYGYDMATGLVNPAATSYADYLNPKGKMASMINVPAAGGGAGAPLIQLLDPWGNEWKYLDRASFPGTNNPDYDLWSIGPDALDGQVAGAAPAVAQDDLVNW